MSTSRTIADATVSVSQNEATARPTRRFSEGMEHMPLAESVLRIGRFSDGAAPSMNMSCDQVGSFADGLVERPDTSATPSVGSFADTSIPARKRRPLRGRTLRDRLAPAHAIILVIAVSMLTGVALTSAAGAAQLVEAKGPYGTTPITHPKLVNARGPFGTTPAIHTKLVKAKGPYGMTPATHPELVKAKGPYGMTTAPSHQARRSGPRRMPPGASAHEALSGWRTAAISEAALLVALTLGSALFLSARGRPSRLRA